MAQETIRNRIKRIQRHLGVVADGLIGPATLTALENALFDDQPQRTAAADFSLTVSRPGLELIVRHEISSAAYYRKFLSHPTWPGGASGITIGIGYDLGYNSELQIRRDWAAQLGEVDLEKLVVVTGLKGDAARQALKGVQSVSVLLAGAREVFYESTLGRFAALTLKTYPGVEDLFHDAQAALLSLVYNRGASLKGARRREMAAIKPLVGLKDYAGLAYQIRSMKRLWEGKGLDGLMKRRDDEARLVLQSDRPYDEEELVRV
jgi:hypothetical protein